VFTGGQIVPEMNSKHGNSTVGCKARQIVNFDCDDHTKTHDSKHKSSVKISWSKFSA
jgi:hypothetical protein